VRIATSRATHRRPAGAGDERGGSEGRGGICECGGLAVRMRRSELQRAEARLAPAPPVASGRVLTVTSPADGVVLKRSCARARAPCRRASRWWRSAIPEAGGRSRTSCRSTAVRVKPGTRAFIDQWGGQQPLEMKVRRIEPAGFTKISALGVEEQRVKRGARLRGPASRRSRVHLAMATASKVHVVLWEAADVLKLPTSTLFRQGDDVGGVCRGGRSRAGEAPGHRSPDRAGSRGPVGAGRTKRL
jgi:HlyD family secretion protein